MKRHAIFFLLALLAGGASAQSQCESLRASGLRLLPRTTFEVSELGLLNGCFSGYLPEGMPLDDGLYRFGVFRDGKLAVPFPVIEAGMDLGSDPYQYLKILATSFNDLDRDGQRDVMVIGQRLIANGERIFVQIYWACGDSFVYDDKTNSDINWDVGNRPVLNVKTVQRYIDARKLKAACGDGDSK